MRLQALISDFDNTLADTNQHIQPAVITAISRLRQGKVIFTMATGRPFYGPIRALCHKLKMTDPIVVSGGAIIVDAKSERIIWQELIDPSTSLQLVDFFMSQKLFCTLETTQCIYSTDGERTKLYGEGVIYCHIDEFMAQPVAKIVLPASIVRFSEEQIDSFVEKLQISFKDLFFVKYQRDGNYGLDITSARASKHTAVLELMKLLKLDRSRVAGVGDSYNDYPLLTACGIKIAMADAPRELLDIADYVAPVQSREGIRCVIEKYFPETQIG